MKFKSACFFCVLLVSVLCGVQPAGGQEPGASSNESALKEFVVKSPRGRFAVRFPGNPAQVGGLGKSPADEQHQFMLEKDDGVLFLSYQDYPKLNIREEARDGILKVAEDAFASSLKASITRRTKLNTRQFGVSGKEARMDIPALHGIARMRSFLIGRRWYSVVAMGSKTMVESQESSDFLNSISFASVDQAKSSTGTSERMTREQLIERLAGY